MSTSTSTLEGVVTIVATTLGIEERAATFGAATPLIDGIPEFDSLAVVEIVTGIEDTFGFEVDAGELTAEVFATFGSLAVFVDASRANTAADDGASA